MRIIENIIIVIGMPFAFLCGVLRALIELWNRRVG